MREPVVALAVLVVVAGLGTAGIAASGQDTRPARVHGPVDASAESPGSSSPTRLASRSLRATALPEFDRTRFIIEVFRNGSARWTFQYLRYLPDNESEKEQFRDYARRFENTTTDLYANFKRRATAIVSAAENETGREMSATNFSRSAELKTEVNVVGVVEMSFLWTAFGNVTDDCAASRCVLVGDVFEGGLFVGESQSLVIKPGPGLEFASIDPNGTLSGRTLADSDSVTWQGPMQFTDEHPRVLFQPRGFDPTTAVTTTSTTTAGTTPRSTTTGTTTTRTTTSTTTKPGSVRSRTTTTLGAGVDGGSGGGGTPWMLVFGVLVVVALGIAGVLVYERGLTPTEAGPTDTAGTTATDTESETSATAGVGSPDAGPAVADEELMTDEDRVLSLLEDNGGRMRQVNIVEETGWSKSKVSMLLSDMEEDGSITKLRVGRENIISLEGEEPDAAGSPFEDDE